MDGKAWLVREYFEPVGRSEARYNFEHFSAAGKVEEYVSLEPAKAAEKALGRDEQVTIGGDAPVVATAAGEGFALNWYTGTGHGVVKRYGVTEPTYEVVRGDLMRWLRGQAAKVAK